MRPTVKPTKQRALLWMVLLWEEVAHRLTGHTEPSARGTCLTLN